MQLVFYLPTFNTSCMGHLLCRGAATTAGWRKAPALAQRVYTRGLASPSSISPKNTMNTAGLEWFGPPERNTLRPLCVVLPSHESEKVARS